MMPGRQLRHNKNNRNHELTTGVSLSGNIRARILLGLLVSCCTVSAVGQEGSSDSDQSPLPANAGTDQVLLVESPQVLAVDNWGERVARLTDEISRFERSAEDADELFYELDRVLHARIQQNNERMKGARSPSEPVNASGELPAGIVSIADLHANINELYDGRLRLLEHLTPGLHLEVTATDVIGVRQLNLEFSFIWEEIRFRALNIPAATENLWRRVQIAPLPIIWQFIKFVLVIGVFRWWRKWLPETLRRMQASLAEIRPRSIAVMRRIRWIWYIGQVRRPLEWMLVFHLLFSMVDVPGLNLINEIVATVVRWILLGWFSVSVLNAFAARGDVGLTGADATVRLKSLRLIATWLVLLGLGLSLAENLAGVATLHAWIWRLFQVLALPVLLILLAWWRKPIFVRLEREDEKSETVNRLLKRQNGLRSFGSAANGAFWLLANALRRNVMRMFLRVGADQSLPFGSTPAISILEAATEAPAGISDDTRATLLAGESGYEKHARTERRQLIRRINSNQGGIVAVVGERGVGKSAFIQNLRAALDTNVISLQSEDGQFAELEKALAHALSVEDGSVDDVSTALKLSDARVVTIDNLHRLVRPVIGGQTELGRLTDLIETTDAEVLWVLSVDCFAWQFLKRARAEQSTISEIVEIPAWTEEQLSELIDQRNIKAGLQPDFSIIQVPSEHAVTTLDTAEERNKAGLYRMLWTLSGGNPAVALRTWADCLFFDEDDKLCVRLPVQPAARELDSAAQNVLLVLRSIAQAEVISETDIVDNLRLPSGAVSSAMHYCISRGWIEEFGGRYRLTMEWFKTITRTLARQNLLAR